MDARRKRQHPKQTEKTKRKPQPSRSLRTWSDARLLQRALNAPHTLAR